MLKRLFFLLLLFLCGQINADQIALPEIELQTFWVSPGETLALDQIINSARLNNINIQKITHNSYDELRSHISSRISLGYPPHISHWVASERLPEYLTSDIILDLPDLISGEKFSKILLPEVNEHITTFTNSRQFLPIGIHLINSTVYNMQILNSLGYSDPPDNWPEFFAMTKRSIKAGIKPVALSDNPWLLRWLFVSILDSSNEHTITDIFFNNKKIPKNEVLNSFEKTFEIFIKLRNLADSDHINRYWANATKMVIKGEAAMQFIGDYAKSEIIGLTDHDNSKFRCVAPPSSNSTIWDMDVFLLLNSSEPDSKKINQRLVNSILDKNTQRDYIYHKGGLSVRADLLNDINDTCANDSQERWKKRNTNLIFSPFSRNHPQIPALQFELSKFWHSKNITNRQAALNLYESLFEK